MGSEIGRGEGARVHLLSRVNDEALREGKPEAASHGDHIVASSKQNEDHSCVTQALHEPTICELEDTVCCYFLNARLITTTLEEYISKGSLTEERKQGQSCIDAGKRENHGSLVSRLCRVVEQTAAAVTRAGI
eukprot:SM000409S15235  [mRNA]  locus=s409:19021:19884:+ [translate_table: standard]